MADGGDYRVGLPGTGRGRVFGRNGQEVLGKRVTSLPDWNEFRVFRTTPGIDGRSLPCGTSAMLTNVYWQTSNTHTGLGVGVSLASDRVLQPESLLETAGSRQNLRLPSSLICRADLDTGLADRRVRTVGRCEIDAGGQGTCPYRSFWLDICGTAFPDRRMQVNPAQGRAIPPPQQTLTRGDFMEGQQTRLNTHDTPLMIVDS